MSELRATLKDVDHYIQDYRDKGGALHVMLTRPDPRASAGLRRLGFKIKNSDPLSLWRN